MGVPLRKLLGKSYRPIVVNGKLLSQGRTPITVGLDNYHVRFTSLGWVSEISEKKGYQMIEEIIGDYSKKYGSIFGKSNYEVPEPTSEIDSFTGAIIITTEEFKILSSDEMHSRDVQHPKYVEDLLKQFVAEYTADYYDSFIYLFNRRIAAQHMPISIRAHLVEGLFQPIYVGTSLIKSPLVFKNNHWLADALAPYEKYLERTADTARKFELSCISMSDISSAFGTPVIFELDRKVFMFMLIATLLSQLDSAYSTALTKKYNYVFRNALSNPIQRARDNGRILTPEQVAALSHYNNAQLFSDMISYASKSRTSLKVV